MKECKYSKILPCYRDGYGVWHHSDETHYKVYELNKQMCDIVRRAEENIRLHNDNNKYARLVRAAYERKYGKPKEKDIMEEKKTKTMTKAEAFEWLKGKKIKCICAVSYEDAQANKVEKFLLEIGCRYHFANHIGWRDWYWPLYGFIVDSKGEIYVAFEDQREFFTQNFNEPISVDDILSIEIVGENRSENELDEIVELGKKIQCLLSKLSGHRHVVITEDDIILREEGMCLFHSDPF